MSAEHQTDDPMDSEEILGLDVDDDSQREDKVSEQRVGSLDPSQRGWMITGDSSTSIEVHGYCALGIHRAEPMTLNRVKVLVQGWIREEAFCDSIVSVDITHEIVTYCSWRPGDLIQLESGGQSPEFFLSTKLNLSLSTLLSDVDTLSFKLTQVPGETLVHVLKYLGHHKGKEPDPLPCPIRSIHMAQIVTDKWDATYVDAMDKKTIFEIILAANYMGIQPLLHLGCAKISTLIKQLDQKEINRIIEEEERYRREQAQAPMTMDSDHEADNDADDDKDEDDEDEGDGNEAENVDAVENVDEAPDDDGDTASDGDDIRIMMRQLSGSPSRIQRRLSASILAMTDSLDVDHDETNVNLDATGIVRSSSAGI